MKDGLNSQEFKEKYTLYPYQHLFQIQKVDPKERELEIRKQSDQSEDSSQKAGPLRKISSELNLLKHCGHLIP